MPKYNIPKDYLIYQNFFPSKTDFYYFYRSRESATAKEKYNFAHKLYKRCPKNPLALSRFGTMTGDYKYMRCGHYDKDRLYALNLLRRALPLFTDQELDLYKMITQNEIFFFSREYLKQYQLGVKYSGTKPNFSKGVGACMHAISLLEKGNKTRAKHYAKLALSEWNKLNKARKNKYNLNIYYMFTLAMNNKYKEANEKYNEIKAIEEELNTYPSYTIYLKSMLVLIQIKLKN